MRILIVEQDRALREHLAGKLAADPLLGQPAQVADLSAAYHAAEHRPPHLVIVGATLALQPEFEVLCLMFRAVSARCQIVHSGARGRQAVAPLAARLGAALLDADLAADEFCTALRSGFTDSVRPRTATAPKPEAAGAFRAGRMILIGSSTGGVDALLQVLSTFPPDCPPTLIVQHTGQGFSAGLARLLNASAAPEVAEARDGERLVPGRVLVAPGSDRHLVLAGSTGATCRLVAEAPVSGHRPSVDALFLSAVPHASRASAALLTGMGRDGAEGLTRLRQAGCATIGQDAASSVVYGMPKVAAEMGGVARQLPLRSIGPSLLAQCRGEFA